MMNFILVNDVVKAEVSDVETSFVGPFRIRGKSYHLYLDTVGEKLQAPGTPANHTESAELTPQLLVKDAENGDQLYKYPLFGMKMEKGTGAGPKMYFHSQPTSPHNDYVVGTLFTPEDNTLYNLKMQIANSTKNGLSLIAKTELSNNGTLPRVVDQVLMVK